MNRIKDILAKLSEVKARAEQLRKAHIMATKKDSLPYRELILDIARLERLIKGEV